MKFISMFEHETHARIKDCFVDQKDQALVFVVEPGELGKAVGKQGAHVKRFEQKLRKKVRVIAFHPEKLQFIQNMIMPLRVRSIEETPDGVVIIDGGDARTRGLLIGRAAQNLRNLEENVRRYFKVKEIRVIQGTGRI